MISAILQGFWLAIWSRHTFLCTVACLVAYAGYIAARHGALLLCVALLVSSVVIYGNALKIKL